MNQEGKDVLLLKVQIICQVLTLEGHAVTPDLRKVSIHCNLSVICVMR